MKKFFIVAIFVLLVFAIVVVSSCATRCLIECGQLGTDACHDFCQFVCVK